MAIDLRVGLLGYGLAGRVFHAPLITTTPGMRLTAVVTGDPGRRAQAASDHPGISVCDDIDQVLAGGVDIVVVATPNRSHVPLALRAIGAGAAVVVDKPFAPTAEEGRRVVAAAAEAGVPLAVFHNRRWDSDFLTVRHLVDTGALGRVLRLESRYERWRPAVREVWRESGDRQDAGGLLFDLGSHLIDQAVWLLGPVSRVYAEVDARRPGAGVDDDVFVALTHVDGARSHLWASSVAAQLGPRLRVLGDRSAFTIFGLDGQEQALKDGLRPGAAGWGQEPPEAWGRSGIGEGTTVVPAVPGRYEVFYRQVVDAVRDGGPMPVDPASAVRVLELIEAAALSAAEGRVVEV